MINLEKLRTYRRILMYPLYFVLVILFVYLAALLLSYFYSGLKEEPFIDISLKEKLESHAPEINWQDYDALFSPRLDKYFLTDLSKAYSSAWYVSQNYSDASLREDYISPEAKLMSFEGDSANYKLVNLDLSHELIPRLVSIDRHYASFTDSSAQIASFLCKDDGEILKYLGSSTRSYEVSMSLDEGRWRIQQFKQLSSTQGYNSVSRNMYNENWEHDKIQGVNYYPASSAWLDFWTNYNSDTTNIDFKKIKELGLNSVRIFIPYLDRDRSAELDEVCKNLTEMLSTAKDLELMVIPTLFDFPSFYSISEFNSTDKYLKSILNVLRDKKNVPCIDLKNEPDKDFEIQGKSTVIAWLEFILDRAVYHYPEGKYTFGWSDPEVAVTMGDKVDVISFHYYGKWPGLDAKLGALRDAFPEKPLVLQEFGISTLNSYFFPGSFPVCAQSDYYKETLRDLRVKFNLPFLFWCLHDYNAVPKEVFGWRPWLRAVQTSFGIIDKHGIEKPAAQQIKSILTEGEDCDCEGSRIPAFYFTALLVFLLCLFFAFRLFRFYKG